MEKLLKIANKKKVYFQLTNFKNYSDLTKLLLPVFTCMFDSGKCYCVVLKSAETNDPLTSMPKDYIWHSCRLLVF